MHAKRRVFTKTIAVLTLSALTFSFSPPASARLFPMLISKSQEIAIGRQVAQAIEAEFGLWNDEEQQRRVQRIGFVIVSQSGRQNMPYTFKILDEPKMVNALAVPGGFIYVTRGLIDIVESDDELAFVLAHEVGHIVGQHSRKAISDAIGLDILLALIFGGASRLVRTAVDVMTNLWQRGYSRKQEAEADAYGLKYLKAAGYDPTAAITMLKKLGGGRYGGLEAILATHPATPDRFKRMAKMLGVSEETLEPVATAPKPLKLPLPTPLSFVREGKIYLVPPKASKAKEVWALEGKKIEWYAWAPEGQKLFVAFREPQSDYLHLYSVNADGTSPTHIATLNAPPANASITLSPDGQWLAAITVEGGHSRLTVISSDGKISRGIGDRMPSGDVLHALWFPDGNRLALLLRRGSGFDGHRVIVAVAHLGGTTRLLEELEGDAANVQPNELLGALPDGRHLLLLGEEEEGEKGLVLLDVDEGRAEWIAHGVESFAWQPKAGVFAFARRSADPASRGLWLARLKEGIFNAERLHQTFAQATPLWQREGSYEHLALSPDGAFLSFEFQEPHAEMPDVWVAALNGQVRGGSTPHLLSVASSQPRFAPTWVKGKEKRR